MVRIRRSLLIVAGCVAVFASERVVGQTGSPVVTGTQIIETEASPVERDPSMLLDRPIDRTQYILGPGDLLALSILGERNQEAALAVSPEGTIVLPTAGVVSVLGLNLDEAERRVRDRVLQYFRATSVRLTLSQVRNFKIYVIGNVPTPGMRPATSVMRLSEVIQPEGNALSQRNIVIRRAGGDSLVVDLARFLHLGEMEQNPTLREGDVIVSPWPNQTVQVHGRVAYPGTYAYRPRETLADFILVANGGPELPDGTADTIRLARFRANGEREILLFSRAEAMGLRGSQLFLQPYDAVFIPATSNFRQQQIATVTGQVVHPGVYPIISGVTTVRQVVALAGGLRPEASLVEASLRRAARGGAVNEFLADIPPEFLTQEELRLRIASMAGDETAVVIDFERLFAAGEDVLDQPLQSGDAISIPQRRDEVVVLGAVVRPGIVTYTAQRDVQHFVSLAGGFSSRADRGGAVVVRGGQGNRIAWKDVTAVEPGDRIIVPFSTQRDWLSSAQTIVTTLSGIVLSLVAVTRIF